MPRVACLVGGGGESLVGVEAVAARLAGDGIG